MKMSKKALTLTLLASLVFVWLIKTPIMASYLTHKIKVPVSIGNVSIWPSQTNIRNFRVRNPHGFKTHSAFSVHNVEIVYDFHQLLQDPRRIQQITMDDIFLSIEFSNPLGTQNNWTAIASKIPPEESRSGKELFIEKLILTNLKVEIRGLGFTGAPQVQQIARLEFDQIDSKKGFPTKQLIQQIFQGAGIQQYIKEAFDPENVLEKVLNPMQGFGG